MPRNLTYFASDVHLGLQVADPAGREARFVSFLRSIPAAETEALYLLGDIWDFWYEYRDVVPKGYVRVFGALTDLMDAGVKVFFFPGNHDIWAYGYFEELGMKILEQPYVTEIGGKTFCLGHGDGLGPVDRGYRILRGIFHNRFLQACFSALHPWFAYRLGNGWSRRSPSMAGAPLPANLRWTSSSSATTTAPWTCPSALPASCSCRTGSPSRTGWSSTPPRAPSTVRWLAGTCRSCRSRGPSLPAGPPRRWTSRGT